MASYNYLGGGLTLREEFDSAFDAVLSNSANYLTGSDFAIIANEYCSVANLVGLAGTIDGQSLFCATYYENVVYLPFKHGGGWFVWDSTKAKSSHNGVSIISPTVPWDGTQATLAAFHAGTGETDASGSGCWVRQIGASGFNVFMAGAVGDGSKDDTTAIKGAISVGGRIKLPGYSYKVSSTIEITSNGTFLEGDGWSTIITRSADYGDTFYLHGTESTGAPLRYCGVGRLYIISTGKTTSGAHIHCEGVNRSCFHDVFMQDGFVGWQLNGLTGSWITRPYLVFTNNYTGTSTGRRYMEFGNATGAYSHPSCGDLFLSDINLRGYTGDQTLTDYGINIISGDGIWITGGHIGNAKLANIYMNSNGSTELLNLIYIANVMVDEGSTDALKIDGDATNFYRDIRLTGCTLKGGPNCSRGFVTGPNLRAYQIACDGLTVTGFQEEGIYLQAPNARMVEFDNLQVFGNGRNTGTAASGIRLAANVKDTKFRGGRSGGGTGSAADVGIQSYGFEFATGHTNVLVSDMDFTVNATGSISGLANGGIEFRNIKSSDSTTIASAATLEILPNGDYFYVSGTTNISAIRASWANRIITLVFADVLTVVNGSNLVLKGSFTTAANYSITLVSDGTNWTEVTRSPQNRFTQNITGGVSVNSVSQSGTIKSDVTTSSAGYINTVFTDASAFTLADAYGYLAQQGTIGAGSAITTQTGFMVSSTLTGATTNYGFRSAIASGTNRWNFYASGTARNFMAGRLDVAGTARTGSVSPSLTNPTNFYSASAAFTDGNTAASGTVAHVAVNSFDNPALAATNATVTYTNASTVYIDGSPTASTNITITNPYSLYVASGNSYFGAEVNTASVFKVNGIQVAGARVTGWTADSGTVKRTANTTYSGTAEAAYTQATIQTLMDVVRDQSQTIKALKDDLIAHGLIGS